LSLALAAFWALKEDHAWKNGNMGMVFFVLETKALRSKMTAQEDLALMVLKKQNTSSKNTCHLIKT
jgi:hypothetical protein